jgi:hypothetical protein
MTKMLIILIYIYIYIIIYTYSIENSIKIDLLVKRFELYKFTTLVLWFIEFGKFI